MTAGRRVLLVAGREVRARLAAKSYRITTVLLMVGALAAVIVPRFAGHGATTFTVAVAGRAPDGLADSLRGGGALAGSTVLVRPLADRPAAEEALRAGTADIALVDGERLIALTRPPPELAQAVRQAVGEATLGRRLADLGVDPTEVDRLLDSPPLPLESLEPPSASRRANEALVFAGLLLVYLALLTYGSLVAAGVVEEKTSRVSEVLLGALRPHQLMGGKVLGIGVAAVVQLVAVATPAAVTALVVGSLEVPAGTPLTFVAVVMWFVLGYGMYSCAFAAAGASAARPEEAGVVSAPLNVVIVASYFVGVRVLASPDDTVSRILSFVPPLSPMTMLARAAVGDVAAWEVPVAVALVVATTWLLVRLTGRIYAGAIVQSGPRVRLRDAWRMAERDGPPSQSESSAG